MTNYRITFVGDTSFCENYRSKLNGEDLIQSKGRAYSLQAVAPLLIASDLVIANLETPLTIQRNSPLKELKKYIHWSDPIESPKVLREHNIGVVSLANNHTLDHGANSLIETFSSLDRNKIKWFGAGDSAPNAQRPYRKKIEIGKFTLPIAVIGAFEYRPDYKHRYNFYADDETPGVNRLGIKRICDQITKLKSKTPKPYVIVYPHWGEDYKWHSLKQTRQAQAIVEAGADLIIGHGTHMLGGIECNGQAWILYSLGNFVFNSPGRYSILNAPPYSLIACLDLSAVADTIELRLKLYPILTHNQQTSYQSRLVNDQEIIEVTKLLESRSAYIPQQMFEWKRDYFGYYFELLC